MGLILLWINIRHRKVIRAGSRKKLDKLSSASRNYSTRIDSVKKKQGELDKEIAREREAFNVLEIEKNRLQDKMQAAIKKKKRQREKIKSLEDSIKYLENRYAKPEND